MKEIYATQRLAENIHTRNSCILSLLCCALYRYKLSENMMLFTAALCDTGSDRFRDQIVLKIIGVIFCIVSRRTCRYSVETFVTP